MEKEKKEKDNGKAQNRSFPGSSAGKRICPQCRRPGLIPGLGRSPGEGNSYPLQYSGLKKSMDCIVHGIAKESDTTDLLSAMHETGVVPWFGKIPWRRKWQPTPVFLTRESHGTEELGRLQTAGLQRVGPH